MLAITGTEAVVYVILFFIAMYCVWHIFDKVKQYQDRQKGE